MKSSLFLLSVTLFFCSCQKQETDFLVDARDGHQYSTVKIGNQWWMAENLAYLPFVSEVEDTSGIWVYGYDGKSVNYAVTLDSYIQNGCLYSWTYTMDISEKYEAEIWGGSDSLHQGVCPDGWHLPSDTEWQQLEDYLDTDPDFTPSDARQNTGNVGKKIKATSTWTGAEDNNETGFGALATGFRYETGHFVNKGKYAYFWSSTEYYAKSALYRYLWDDSEGTFRGYPLKTNGLSIRCVKN
ncbi:MAG: hypothetical protein KAH17_05465 [Bacteroidales bacterium]|nr:hypothetical protein [Bacteroidales bacterium]